MCDGDATDLEAASPCQQQQPVSSEPQASSRRRRRRHRDLHLQLAACTPSLRLPRSLLPPRRCICRPAAAGTAARCSLPARCAGLCDICTSVAIQDVAKKSSPWRHLIAGALAGAASRTATAPLETLRLQAMCGAGVAAGPVTAARQIVAAAGWRGLFRGNATNVLRSAPQKALDFFAFDVLKGMLHAGGSGPRVFAAAGLAGCTTNVLLYPLEVVRTRLTADTGGRYTGVIDAFRKVSAAEGVSGMYRGLLPSAIAMLPEAAITYGMFDTLKARHRDAHGGAEPGMAHVLSFGVASAFCGQAVAFPLETVARRLQVNGGSNFAALTARIVQEGGPAALYRGIGAASLRVVPMACVSFGTYELVRGAIARWEDASNATAGPHTAAAQLPLQLQCSRRRRPFEMQRHSSQSAPAIDAAVPAVTSASRRAQ